MPSQARPPERTSSVVTVFASMPGKRYEIGVASARNPAVRVAPARKARVEYASSTGPAASPAYGCCQTWSITPITSNPAASAACPIPDSVSANSEGGTGQAKSLMWRPSFIASSAFLQHVLVRLARGSWDQVETIAPLMNLLYHACGGNVSA